MKMTKIYICIVFENETSLANIFFFTTSKVYHLTNKLKLTHMLGKTKILLQNIGNK